MGRADTRFVQNTKLDGQVLTVAASLADDSNIAGVEEDVASLGPKPPLFVPKPPPGGPSGRGPARRSFTGAERINVASAIAAAAAEEAFRSAGTPESQAASLAAMLPQGPPPGRRWSECGGCGEAAAAVVVNGGPQPGFGCLSAGPPTDTAAAAAMGSSGASTPLLLKSTLGRSRSLSAMVESQSVLPSITAGGTAGQALAPTPAAAARCGSRGGRSPSADGSVDVAGAAEPGLAAGSALKLTRRPSISIRVDEVTSFLPSLSPGLPSSSGPTAAFAPRTPPPPVTPSSEVEPPAAGRPQPLPPRHPRTSGSGGALMAPSPTDLRGTLQRQSSLPSAGSKASSSASSLPSLPGGSLSAAPGPPVLGSCPSPLQQQLQAARATLKRSSSSSCATARPGGVEGAVWSWEAEEADARKNKDSCGEAGGGLGNLKLVPLPVIGGAMNPGGGMKLSGAVMVMPQLETESSAPMRPMTPRTGRWSCPGGGAGGGEGIRGTAGGCPPTPKALAPLIMPSIGHKSEAGRGAGKPGECQVLLLDKSDFYRGNGGEAKVRQCPHDSPHTIHGSILTPLSISSYHN